ncbi:hypothetical protein AV530_004914 [Patagioenas fasciata monilis]|uniref:Uncharacterized protein n=1 Tax=Patagioenas fasciata monilis TaxID=372326 RepID=A0A1V4K3D0_PATFA|nr:hypothetical protein AV530_004914 [Patagioenas fasciata monilis]
MIFTTAFLLLEGELSASYLSELGHCWTRQEPLLASGKWKQLPAWKKKEDKKHFHSKKKDQAMVLRQGKIIAACNNCPQGSKRFLPQ